jgi:hypothetical protein
MLRDLIKIFLKIKTGGLLLQVARVLIRFLSLSSF